MGALLSAIPLPWKLAGMLALALAFVGAYVKGRLDGNAAVYTEMEAKVASAQHDADVASSDVLIAQAIAMGANQQKAKSYVAEIKSAAAAAPAVDCGHTAAARAASRGVRALCADCAEAGRAPAGRLPAAPAGR